MQYEHFVTEDENPDQVSSLQGGPIIAYLHIQKAPPPPTPSPPPPPLSGSNQRSLGSPSNTEYKQHDKDPL